VIFERAAALGAGRINAHSTFCTGVSCHSGSPSLAPYQGSKMDLADHAAEQIRFLIFTIASRSCQMQS
ncbi:MAG: hypothetical protein ACSLFC_08225, partial [Desulfuromonadales bacterium]